MKRILIVTEVFYPENGLVNDFALELSNRGFAIEVLTQYPSYPQGHVFDGYTNQEYGVDEWNGIKIHRFEVVEGYRESKIKKILNYYKFVSLGTKIATRIGKGFDHVLVYQTGPLTLALPAVQIKKKFSIPLTVWTFDIWPDAVYAYGFPAVFPLTTFLNAIIKKVYKNADNILVSSRNFAQTINQYVPTKNIEYAPNWLIDEPEVRCELKLDSTKFNFTFTGNISKAQNLENVIQGWKLANLEDKAILNIVGDGSNLPLLKNRVEMEDIKGVVFHGRFPSNQMQSIICQSDMLILSLVADRGISKTEPFKLQSYLKSGKPIFGVVQGAAREIIEQNRLGVCAEPDYIENIAQIFVQAMKDTMCGNFAGVEQRSQKLLDNRFNRQKTIEKVIQTIAK